MKSNIVFLAVVSVAILFAAESLFADTSRIEIPLDADWRFILHDGDTNYAAASFGDGGWQTVSLPHTWNALDGQNGGSDYFRGTGWYRIHFCLPLEAKGRRVLLEFDAASRVADVFVNGQTVRPSMVNSPRCNCAKF